MRTGAIVQARIGSTRLPGKVIIDICGKPVIQHVIERLKQSKYLHEIIIATTELKQDDVIVEQAVKAGVKWFRGSEEDVLSRYYYAAKENNLDVIVRITSDCPLIDPYIIDEMIQIFINNDYNMVSNVSLDVKLRTFPRGLDAEIFPYTVLKEVFDNASEKYQREHVTPYIYENCNKFFLYKNPINYSKYRWTLDTGEDLEMIKTVYNHLYHGEHNFFFRDITGLLEKHPEIADINRGVEQKKLKT